MTRNYYIYTDGACSNNPGPCGSGIVIFNNKKIIYKFYGSYRENGTNNIAELLAIKYGIKSAIQIIKKRNTNVTIYSDSKYCINSLTIWKNWKKNTELLSEIFEIYKDYKDNILLKYVKAHSGIKGNEIADSLAKMAIECKQKNIVKYNGDIQINKDVNNNKNNKIYLNIKFSEKDMVKNLGAKWDKNNKKWYCFSNNVQLFDEWL